MRHDFLSGNSISEPLTVSNDQMEKTVIAEKLIDFSFLINPKWKKTCSSLSRQCMWERRREERERGERIIIKITQINLGECSCHFSALSIRGKCRFTPASFVSNVSSNEDHQTTVLSHLKGGFSGHYSTCILPATSVGQNALHFLFVRPECASYSAKWKINLLSTEVGDGRAAPNPQMSFLGDPGRDGRDEPSWLISWMWAEQIPISTTSRNLS